MVLIQIGVDTHNKIISPGDKIVRRDEDVGWYCKGFGYEVEFPGAKNAGNAPPHPFRTAPPNPPPGHVTGDPGETHHRHVRPRSATTTIPDGTRYHYNITIKDANGNPVDSIDPDIIVEGDKP